MADLPPVSSRTVVLATGSAYRRLGVPALDELIGAGVFYGGPVSEAPAMVGKRAFVIGGANSAGQAALHLARYVKRVASAVGEGSIAVQLVHQYFGSEQLVPDVRAGAAEPARVG